jgi:hypothetical protein
VTQARVSVVDLNCSGLTSQLNSIVNKIVVVLLFTIQLLKQIYIFNNYLVIRYKDFIKVQIVV